MPRTRNTQALRRIWAYISECAEQGWPCTYRSIAKTLGLSLGGSLVYSIDSLEELGYITRDMIPSGSRGKIHLRVPLITRPRQGHDG